MVGWIVDKHVTPRLASFFVTTLLDYAAEIMHAEVNRTPQRVRDAQCARHIGRSCAGVLSYCRHADQL